MGVFNNFPYANFHELNADWIIEQVRKVMDDWEEYKTDMDLWKLGVDDQLAEFQAWFDNLDVQDEVRTVMNELILSGEFIEITSPQIVSATEAWLAAHITPTTPAVDDTLSISGAAADAKVTGDRITDLKEDITEIIGFDPENLITEIILGYVGNSDGTLITNGNFSHSNDIDVTNIDVVMIMGSLHIYDTSQFTALGVFYDSSNNVVGRISEQVTQNDNATPWYIKVPSNAVKLIINTDYKKSDYPNSVPDRLLALEMVPSKYTRSGDISASKQIKVLAGVVRNAGDGWVYIDDANHTPMNLSSVSVNSNGQLVIGYGFTAKKVLSLVVTPDETFARKYLVGGSVGLSDTVININKVPEIIGGRVVLNNGTFDVSSYSTFSSASIETNGEIKLYHDSVDYMRAKQKFNITAFCNSPNYKIIAGSQGNDYISLYVYDNSNNKITDFTNISFSMFVNRIINSVLVNANNVVDAGGNFWIYGVMEV